MRCNFSSALPIAAAIAGLCARLSAQTMSGGDVTPVDPRKLYVVAPFGAVAGISLAGKNNSAARPLSFRRANEYGLAEIRASDLDSDGSVTLAGEGAVAAAAGGVYLLPGLPEASLQSLNRDKLRRWALAAREGGAGGGGVRLDRAIPLSLDFRAADARAQLEVFGERMLSERAVAPLWCGDAPAVFEKMLQAGPREQTMRYRDPEEPRNILELTLQPKGDRVKVSLSYQANIARDRDVAVRFRLPLAREATSLWGVAWRFTRSTKGGTGEQKFTEGKSDESLFSFMSQAPLSLVRMADDSYLGILDNDLGNLVVELARHAGHDDTVSVSTYLWPREQGRRYEWTFEVMGGFENFYNAVLRATWPYTKDNHEIYQGVLGREVYNEFPTLGVPEAAGVRAIWFHGWFRRNGDYFNPAWPKEQPYDTPYTKYESYATLKRSVQRLQQGKYQVFLYIQFAGISEDMADRFKDSLVKDREGNTIRAGQDGQRYNLWVNPDPAGEYGRSVLEQIGQLLDYTGADGIALDRADRLDWTYGPDLFDYGHFNGYSSVFGERRPVASMTIAGKAWLVELRKLLDRKGRKLVINAGATLFAIELADSNMMEITGDPTALFLGKAFGNGRSVTYTVHGRLTEASNNFIAEMAQGYPYHRLRVQSALNIEGMATSERFEPDVKRGRLLYALSEDGRSPTLWYFDNGHTELKFNAKEQNMEMKLRGSRFVPRSEER